MSEKVSIKWFDTIDSTNNEAQRCAEADADMTVYSADFQTNGRGQRGNKWESGRCENLTFTILLKPTFLMAEEQSVISQITSLAIVNYLKTKGIEAKIKWPNDIYVGDKKICGILIEHALSGANLSVSIVGIGLNLNQMHFSKDAPNPTSLRLESGCPELDRREELAIFIEHFYSLYEKLRSFEGEAGHLSNMESVAALYREKLYRLGEFHHFIETPPAVAAINAQIGTCECKDGEALIEGKIVGIDANSCLIIELKDGSRRSYAFKEIKYVI